jgi:hypothetical protein
MGRTLADTTLPEILEDDGCAGTAMSTSWLATESKRYCVGVCWGVTAAPSPFASANCW